MATTTVADTTLQTTTLLPASTPRTTLWAARVKQVTLDPMKLTTTPEPDQTNYLFDTFNEYFSNMFFFGETVLWPIFALMYGGSLIAFIVGRSILFSRQGRRQREFCAKLRQKRLEQKLKEEAEERERLAREADENDPEPKDEIEKIAWWIRRLGRPLRISGKALKRTVRPDLPYSNGYDVPLRWDFVNDVDDDDAFMEAPVTALQADVPAELLTDDTPVRKSDIGKQDYEGPKIFAFKPVNVNGEPPKQPAPPKPVKPPTPPPVEDDDDDDADFMMDLGVTSRVEGVQPPPTPARQPSAKPTSSRPKSAAKNVEKDADTDDEVKANNTEDEDDPFMLEGDD